MGLENTLKKFLSLEGCWCGSGILEHEYLILAVVLIVDRCHNESNGY